MPVPRVSRPSVSRDLEHDSAGQLTTTIDGRRTSGAAIGQQWQLTHFETGEVRRRHVAPFKAPCHPHPMWHGPLPWPAPTSVVAVFAACGLWSAGCGRSRLDLCSERESTNPDAHGCGPRDFPTFDACTDTDPPTPLDGLSGAIQLSYFATMNDSEMHLYGEAMFFASARDGATVRPALGRMGTWVDAHSGFAWVPEDGCANYDAPTNGERLPLPDDRLDVGSEIQLSCDAGTLAMERTDTDVQYVFECGENLVVPGALCAIRAPGSGKAGEFTVDVRTPDPLVLEHPALSGPCGMKDCCRGCLDLQPAADLRLKWTPSCFDGDGDVIVIGSDTAGPTPRGNGWVCRFRDDGSATIPDDVIGDSSTFVILRQRTQEFRVPCLEAPVGLVFSTERIFKVER